MAAICQWARGRGLGLACDPASLLSSAACFACLSADQRQCLELAILCRIKDRNTAACDVNVLLGESQCWQCLTPGQREIAAIGLLCQIVQG